MQCTDCDGCHTEVEEIYDAILSRPCSISGSHLVYLQLIILCSVLQLLLLEVGLLPVAKAGEEWRENIVTAMLPLMWMLQHVSLMELDIL